jgi:hypothetical protein
MPPHLRSARTAVINPNAAGLNMDGLPVRRVSMRGGTGDIRQSRLASHYQWD